MVILDIKMPKLNGFEACRSIREQDVNWLRKYRYDNNIIASINDSSESYDVVIEVMTQEIWQWNWLRSSSMGVRSRAQRHCSVWNIWTTKSTFMINLSCQWQYLIEDPYTLAWSSTVLPHLSFTMIHSVSYLNEITCTNT